MRVAVISDLHSNREALEAVYAHIQSQDVEAIYCLGDVVGYGPDPEFCVDLVRGHAELCLMGNHDEALFHNASDFNPHARKAIEYTAERMRPRWWSSSEKKARWSWLRSLPHTQQRGKFTLVHGSPRDPVREYVLSTDGILNQAKLRSIFDSFDSVAVAGHTHHPGMHTEDLRFAALHGQQTVTMALPTDGKAFINVGSVGQPRDGDSRASYAILEEHQVTWHRVQYDFRITQDKIHATGVLPELLARRLEMGK